MATHPAATSHWFVPVAVTAAVMIALLALLRLVGVLSPQPLEQTQLVSSIMWGLVIAFILQFVFSWRARRKYTVTAASLAKIPEPGSSELPERLRTLDKKQLIDSIVFARIRKRGAFMLGNVSGALAMLAGLYVITKSAWFLLALALYAVFSAWIFRPIDPQEALQK